MLINRAAPVCSSGVTFRDGGGGWQGVDSKWNEGKGFCTCVMQYLEVMEAEEQQAAAERAAAAAASAAAEHAPAAHTPAGNGKAMSQSTGSGKTGGRDGKRLQLGYRRGYWTFHAALLYFPSWHRCMLSSSTSC